MNVAKLELCKELYGLSGWGDELEYGWVESQIILHPEPFDGEYQAPAYDSGYLLRKLPYEIDDYWFGIWKFKKGYSCGYVDVDVSIYERNGVELHTDANTPEDALCLLAIELFKQGVLERS